MFKYLNAEGRNAEFSIDSENPSILHVGGFKFEGMQIKPTDFDLSEYAGEMVRVYLDADGSYSMEHGTHEWLLFMGMVPDLKYKTVLDGLDEHGVEKTKSVEVAPDLNDTVITIFDLPEEEE
jgi:hypothetical protein